MSPIARLIPDFLTVYTDEPDWVDAIVEALLDGEPVVVKDGPRRCLIPGGVIRGAVWAHARRHLRHAGIRAPMLPR